MKASEFVAQIQALIAEHGDLEVLDFEPCEGKWVENKYPPFALIREGDKVVNFGVTSL